MAPEVYLDVLIIDNYEESKIEIIEKEETPRAEKQAELRAFF